MMMNAAPRPASSGRIPVGTILPILIVAFLLRLAYYHFFVSPSAQVSEFSPFLFPDSAGFYEYARSLAERGEYIDSVGRIAWRMPGYSLLLALLLKCGASSLCALHLPNLLLGTLNTGLAMALARKIFFSWRAALLAGIMLACYPFIIFLDGLMLSDTLAVTGVLCLSLAGVRYVNAQGWRQLLLASFLVAASGALCAYAKASAGLLLVIYIPFLLLAQRYSRLCAGGLGVRWGTVMAVTFCVLLYPWVHRNETLFKEFVPFSTMGGFTLWEATGPGADGGANHGKVEFPQIWQDMQERQRSPERTLADTDDVLTYALPGSGRPLEFSGQTRAELAADAYLMASSITEIKKDTNRALTLCFRKFMRTWSPIPNWVGAPFWPYGLLMLLSFGPVMLLSILGLSVCRANWRMTCLLWLPAVYFSLVHAVFMGSVRYRVPAEACLIVLAAGVLDLLLARFFPPKHPSSAEAAKA